MNAPSGQDPLSKIDADPERKRLLLEGMQITGIDALHIDDPLLERDDMEEVAQLSRFRCRTCGWRMGVMATQDRLHAPELRKCDQCGRIDRKRKRGKKA